VVIKGQLRICFRGIGCSQIVGAGGTAIRGLAEIEIMLTLLVAFVPLPFPLARPPARADFATADTIAVTTIS
jgi:hypothetical protein